MNDLGIRDHWCSLLSSLTSQDLGIPKSLPNSHEVSLLTLAQHSHLLVRGKGRLEEPALYHQFAWNALHLSHRASSLTFTQPRDSCFLPPDQTTPCIASFLHTCLFLFCLLGIFSPTLFGPQGNGSQTVLCLIPTKLFPNRYRRGRLKAELTQCQSPSQPSRD